eukprot:2488527-Rhodomonas_salina.1
MAWRGSLSHGHPQTHKTAEQSQRSHVTGHSPLAISNTHGRHSPCTQCGRSRLPGLLSPWQRAGHEPDTRVMMPDMSRTHAS